jgi:hypothetical protein
MSDIFTVVALIIVFILVNLALWLDENEFNRKEESA